MNQKQKPAGFILVGRPKQDHALIKQLIKLLKFFTRVINAAQHADDYTCRCSFVEKDTNLPLADLIFNWIIKNMVHGHGSQRHNSA